MDQFLNLTVILFFPVKWVGNLPSRSHRILWLNQDLKTKRALHFSIIYTLSLCGRLWWVEWTPGLFNGEGLQLILTLRIILYNIVGILEIHMVY